MLKDIIAGLQSYYKAHLFIKEHRLWRWIIIPGLFYCILFIISMYFFGVTASHMIDVVSYRTGLKQWLEARNSGLLGFIFTLASIIVWLLQMMLYFSWFKYIILIIGSPLFAYLSERTKAIIKHVEFEFDAIQFRKNIFRGIAVAFINLFWQTLYMVSILLLSFIPVAGWLTPLLALLVECYYYGFSMLDYSAKESELSITESNYFISHNKGLAIGNGLAFYLIHCLPVIGWVVAPAYAIVAGCLSMYSMNKTLVNDSGNLSYTNSSL